MALAIRLVIISSDYLKRALDNMIFAETGKVTKEVSPQATIKERDQEAPA